MNLKNKQKFSLLFPVKDVVLGLNGSDSVGYALVWHSELINPTRGKGHWYGVYTYVARPILRLKLQFLPLGPSSFPLSFLYSLYRRNARVLYLLVW